MQILYLRGLFDTCGQTSIPREPRKCIVDAFAASMQLHALFSNHSVMVQVVAGLTALMLHIQLDYI